MKTRPYWRFAVRSTAVKLLILMVLSTLLTTTGALAFAQEEKAKKAEKTVKSGDKKETKIDFEDELVEGELKKPELFYLLQKKQFNFKRLIKLREDFLPEMRRDADEIRRGRSKN